MPPKSASGKPKYSEGEKILCFHGPLLYEAKCLGVEVKDSHIKYFVHYQGWNKNWDEWVGDARIMKFNAVGLQKQKELKEFYSKPGKKLKGLRKSELLNQEYPPPEALRRLESAGEAGTDAGPSGSSQQQQQPPPPPPPPPPVAGVKRARESSSSAAVATAADESTSADSSVTAASVQTGKRLRIQIELPRPLRCWLADDAELVCKQRRLHSLPPPPTQTISGILGRFVTSQSAANSDEFERERLSEFVAGLQSYFNAVLSTQLLYSAERLQYSALLRAHRGAMPCSLYGVLHLLRLFVRLGDLLSHTKLDLKCLNSLLDYCDSLLLFVEKNIDQYASVNNYDPPDARLSTSN